MHDPNDPNVSDECRAHLKRGMMAGMVAVMAMLLTGVLIVTVRAFGLQHIFYIRRADWRLCQFITVGFPLRMSREETTHLRHDSSNPILSQPCRPQRFSRIHGVVHGWCATPQIAVMPICFRVAAPK